MKKLLSALFTMLIFSSLFLTGCGDDENTPKIDFQSETSTVTEGATSTVQFSSSVPSGIVPNITLGGTATQGTDYTFTISSTGISFTILDDQFYDPSETIIVTLTGFDGNAAVGTKAVHTITINDIDHTASPGLKINLSWNAGGGSPGNVDMDLFLWYETSPGSDDFEFVDGAFSIGTTFEEIFLPSNNNTLYPNGIYGLGYNYYEGTSNNLAVRADFRSFGGNINGTSNRAFYTAIYTLANINPWEDTDEFYIVQVFEKAGTNFINFSPIDVPLTGSRAKEIRQAREKFKAKRN
ncbi:MAG: hypothetical protein KF725_00795 [Cyclobacteriaceae bacterium]|nr:hypothetical protein [Cyclobacteriaceae bacterium]UYN87004.1 MAG: hypothetical protein KIT51_01610 [Cyclobacteriaceae bacterium]